MQGSVYVHQQRARLEELEQSLLRDKALPTYVHLSCRVVAEIDASDHTQVAIVRRSRVCGLG